MIMRGENNCPRCKSAYVYGEHNLNDKWIIRCAHCNRQTKEFDTLEDARSAWEQMKGEQK